MAIALSGCVIVDDRPGQNVVIKEKCDKCGTLANGTHGLAPIPKGMKHNSTYVCKKCGNRFNVVVQG